MNETKLLFDELKKYRAYPETMIRICGDIEGTAFFPGGRGLINKDDTSISNKKVMILGQDFDSETGYQKSRDNDSENIDTNPTWRNLREFLKQIPIEESDCFFTNAIMGARKGNEATGKSPAFKDQAFIEHCQEIFKLQLTIQKPELILVLGKHPAEFLVPLSEDLTGWLKIKSFNDVDKNDNPVRLNVTLAGSHKTNLVLLLHPSMRKANLRFRKYGILKHNDAEIAMVRKALQNTSKTLENAS